MIVTHVIIIILIIFYGWNDISWRLRQTENGSAPSENIVALISHLYVNRRRVIYIIIRILYNVQHLIIM